VLGQHQHQSRATSKLVEEMEAVVRRHPPFYCEVEWSVVSNRSGMSSSWVPCCSAAERAVCQCRWRISCLTILQVWMRCGGLTNVDTVRGREAA
jgi:hypothetical protein